MYDERYMYRGWFVRDSNCDFVCVCIWKDSQAELTSFAAADAAIVARSGEE